MPEHQSGPWTIFEHVVEGKTPRDAPHFHDPSKVERESRRWEATRRGDTDSLLHAGPCPTREGVEIEMRRADERLALRVARAR